MWLFDLYTGKLLCEIELSQMGNKNCGNPYLMCENYEFSFSRVEDKESIHTVLPAKSDSDVMFCLQSHQGLIIKRSLVYQSYPQDRIDTQVIYRFALAQVECTSYFLLNDCKQNIASLSLLVGTTVVYVNF